MSTPEQQAADDQVSGGQIAAALVAAFAAQQAAQAEGGAILGLPIATRAATAAKVLALLLRWLTAQRGRTLSWLREVLVRSLGRDSQAFVDDVARVIAEEEVIEQVFQRKALERAATDVADALALPTAQEREAHMQRVMNREKRYAGQRAEAQLVRASAALQRAVLRRESPDGAFWKLDPNVSEHTAGCRALGGRFWPWQVLDRVHPPRHTGCPCSLHSYGVAVASGWLRPQDVLPVSVAVRLAAPVRMEVGG